MIVDGETDGDVLGLAVVVLIVPLTAKHFSHVMNTEGYASISGSMR